MILNVFSRTPRSDTIVSLYGAIVAQARVPDFYRFYGVPDTVNGRFEMVVLHAVLLLTRLAGGQNTEIRQFGQAVFDHFCSDMDGNLREMGVGDMAVPRKMKSIGEAFYGRKQAYEAAMNDPGSLAAALARNVYGDMSASGAQRLAAYVQEAADRLRDQNDSALASGRAVFPDPMDPVLAPGERAGTGAP
jgi:cytochrome b pre-mRNA-processing protein 3